MKFSLIRQSAKILSSREEIKQFGSIVESSAKTCYNSTRTMNTYKENEFSNEFIRSLIVNGHHSTLEHCYIRVEFIMSRGMLLDLTRHRLASFSVQSTRYCNYSDDIKYILSPGMLKFIYDTNSNPLFETYVDTLKNTSKTYSRMVKYGIPQQLAKEILPTSLATICRMTMNLRELRHVLSLRGERHAHPDIQTLMSSLTHELIDNGFPQVFLEGCPNNGKELYDFYMTSNICDSLCVFFDI